MLIDLVLSGDNAVVIGMAAHRLPPPQRRLAIAGGAGMAIALRVALTVVASLLLQITYLQLAGGLVLLWIAFKLLREERSGSEDTHQAATLWSAMGTIVVADLVMSTDNILGVAGAAHGNIRLLLFGLVLSMGLMMLGGSFVASLLNRVPWLAYLAAAAIVWTAVDMVLHDPAVDGALALPVWGGPALALATAGLVVWTAGWPQRRSRAQED